MEELGRIILAYSEVTDRLQQSQVRLEKTVQALREELGEKNRKLERRNRLAALGEMAAGMAHEIRNPLGGIQLYAAMLAQDVADRPAALATTQKIASGVKRLEALVSQVLQFTREISAQRVPCDLAEIVAQSCESAAPHAQKANVMLHVCGPQHLPITADPLLLGQAVLNLLLNAVEAAGAGGTVQLTYGPAQTSPSPAAFTLQVADSGPGLAPQVIDKIFNPFFTTKDTGTGLGLAIVHRIVEAHEGTVSASNQPGGGALFEIRI